MSANLCSEHNSHFYFLYLVYCLSSVQVSSEINVWCLQVLIKCLMKCKQYEALHQWTMNNCPPHIRDKCNVKSGNFSNKLTKSDRIWRKSLAIVHTWWIVNISYFQECPSSSIRYGFSIPGPWEISLVMPRWWSPRRSSAPQSSLLWLSASRGCIVQFLWSIAVFDYFRYLAICRPLSPLSRSTMGKAKKIILLIWIISFLSAFPWALFTKVRTTTW